MTDMQGQVKEFMKLIVYNKLFFILLNFFIIVLHMLDHRSILSILHQVLIIFEFAEIKLIIFFGDEVLGEHGGEPHLLFRRTEQSRVTWGFDKKI